MVDSTAAVQRSELSVGQHRGDSPIPVVDNRVKSGGRGWVYFDRALKGGVIVVKTASQGIKALNVPAPEFLDFSKIGLNHVTALSQLLQGKIIFACPKSLRGVTLIIRDWSKGVQAVVSLTLPVLFISRGLKVAAPHVVKIQMALQATERGRLALKVAAVGQRGIDQYALFLERTLLPRVIQVVRVFTLIAAIEVFYRALRSDDLSDAEKFYQAVEVTKAALDVLLVALKIAGVVSGAWIPLEVASLIITAALFAWELYMGTKPEKKLKEEIFSAA